VSDHDPAARRAGVPWASFPHVPPHGGERVLRAGWNAKQVQIVLGHHSPAFTLATYVHLIPDDLPDPGFLDDLTTGDESHPERNTVPELAAVAAVER